MVRSKPDPLPEARVGLFDLTCGLSFAIGLEPFRHARRLVGGGGVAAWAWCTGSAAGAGVRAGPCLIQVNLADPAGATDF